MHRKFSFNKWAISCISTLILILGIGVIHPPIAYAEDLKKAEDNLEAFKDINVFDSKQGSKPSSDTFKKFNSLLVLAITVGGFVVLANIIIAGMKITASISNPALRTNGIIGLICAIFGGWMLYKCMSIVGWFGMIFKNSKSGKAGLVSDLNSIMIILLGMGGFIVVGSLLYAGSKLSLSQTNANERTKAIAGLISAGIGAYIIYKSFDIAGYIGGI
ncbi:hypothetical protein BK784_28600 [Bacillus thuringiensis serovar medellin]|uniref:Uncharacterized protein n=1 Tax=Bacillus thuringiensis subsp. medellin TaxID=79672 RepID=A0A9X6N471_BACTV|nr:hypothetical protein [Bacillus thuringiensis]OUB88478.1 hypothetical protein BK784_28600 [Bacillus thuringiensis serovar medellin]